ncbi:MAG TPA: methyltransferase domain-containing protein [Flavisolibacter sp.]|nr:methyltransferase domain-containing protein [Flavisolibacter sp.]
MAKDLFSEHAKLYAQFRPTYPQILFDYIISFVKDKNTAWDCATGNGQAAMVLADYFQTVWATDISEAQLSNAIRRDNIHYSVSSAEHTIFDDDTFDLITIAMAYHWLDPNAFFKEARRIGKNNCVVAAWTYTTLHTDDEELDELYQHFYTNITQPYWEAERRLIDEKYQTITFDFSPLPEPPFETKMLWSREQFLGYLSTWSAVQKYTKINGTSPLDLIQEKINALWPYNEIKEIVFPLSLRLGRIVK